jgi:uncharacterized protein YndB with AHSA1/START domain
MSYQKMDSQYLAKEEAQTLDILASIRIKADPRRILYALAMPEYIETWLSIPGADRIECCSERRSYDSFRIDLFSSGVMSRSIHGSCFLSKPNRIIYTWERDHTGRCYKSIVNMHLSGGTSLSKLWLRHSGLSNWEEREWHLKMWNSDLALRMRIS